MTSPPLCWLATSAPFTFDPTRAIFIKTDIAVQFLLKLQ